MVAHAFNLAPQGQKQVDLSESQTSLLDIGEFQASRELEQTNKTTNKTSKRHWRAGKMAQKQ